MVRDFGCRQPADGVYDPAVRRDSVLYEGHGSPRSNHERRIQGDVSLCRPASARTSTLHLLSRHQPVAAETSWLPRLGGHGNVAAPNASCKISRLTPTCRA